MKTRRLPTIICAVVLVLSMAVQASASSFQGSIPITAAKDVNLGAKDSGPIYDPVNEAINQAKTQAADNALAILRASGNQTRATTTVSVPCAVRKQVTTYWCGLASALQTINADKGTVASSTGSFSYDGAAAAKPITSPQVTINSYVGGVGTAGADMGQLSNAVNHYKKSTNFTWSYTYISNNTTGMDSFQTKMNATIESSKKTCIIYVYANKLSRYSGSNFGGHYVTVNGFTRQSFNTPITVKIVDPNYNSTYGGTFSESTLTVIKAMQRSSGAPNLLW